MWVWSLNHCIMTSFALQMWCRNVVDIQNLSQEWVRQWCDNGSQSPSITCESSPWWCESWASFTAPWYPLHCMCDMQNLIGSNGCANKSCAYGMMVDSSDLHSHHTYDLHNCAYVWSGCGNNSMWICSLYHCTMTSFALQMRLGNVVEAQNLCQQELW